MATFNFPVRYVFLSSSFFRSGELKLFWYDSANTQEFFFTLNVNWLHCPQKKCLLQRRVQGFLCNSDKNLRQWIRWCLSEKVLHPLVILKLFNQIVKQFFFLNIKAATKPGFMFSLVEIESIIVKRNISELTWESCA